MQTKLVQVFKRTSLPQALPKFKANYPLLLSWECSSRIIFFQLIFFFLVTISHLFDRQWKSRFLWLLLKSQNFSLLLNLDPTKSHFESHSYQTAIPYQELPTSRIKLEEDWKTLLSKVITLTCIFLDEIMGSKHGHPHFCGQMRQWIIDR